MGHSQAEKAETHARIVKIAAARFREAGLDGLSLADLMKEAGLTHGGFYRHFDSRDELVAEAVAAALTQANGSLAGASFERLVDHYLSPDHRDGIAEGCAVTALAADMTRANPAARDAYTAQVKRNLAALARLIPGGDRAAAIMTMTSLLGALSLARAVNDEALSLEILETVRESLKAAPIPSPASGAKE